MIAADRKSQGGTAQIPDLTNHYAVEIDASFTQLLLHSYADGWDCR
jgi:hypothetical protein